jgi:hypothetical protein
MEGSTNTSPGEWILIDGNYSQRKFSTNGTWVFLSDPTDVYTGMVIKANHTTFQAQVI